MAKAVNAATRPASNHFEIFATENRRWVWILYTTNRRPIAASPVSYKRREDTLRVIENLKAIIGPASIVFAQTSEKNAEQPTTPQETESAEAVDTRVETEVERTDSPIDDIGELLT